jgi:hypothetical protein
MQAEKRKKKKKKKRGKKKSKRQNIAISENKFQKNPRGSAPGPRPSVDDRGEKASGGPAGGLRIFGQLS